MEISNLEPPPTPPPSSKLPDTSQMELPHKLNVLSNDGAAVLNSRSRYHPNSVESANFPRSPISLIEPTSDAARPTTSPALLSGSSPTSNGLGKVTRSKKSPKTLFSKTNYLLLAPATTSEVSTFLLMIQRSLVKISDFYISENGTTAQRNSRYGSMKPQLTSRSSHSRQSVIEDDPSNGVQQYMYSRTTGTRINTASPNHTQSRSLPGKEYADSVRSGKTMRTMRTTNTAAERERASEKEWVNFLFEDDEEDEFDRLYIGEGFRKAIYTGGHLPSNSMTDGLVVTGGRKGNSRKALKWLGLA
jgi:hypothetical protein